MGRITQGCTRLMSSRIVDKQHGGSTFLKPEILGLQILLYSTYNGCFLNLKSCYLDTWTLRARLIEPNGTPRPTPPGPNEDQVMLD